MVLLCVHKKDFFLSTYTPGDCFACSVLTKTVGVYIRNSSVVCSKEGCPVKKPGNARGEGHFMSFPNWMSAPRPRK